MKKSRQNIKTIWTSCAAAVFAFAVLAVTSISGPATPTFSKDVAPILFRNCVNCHRPGEIAGTASLVSYDTARPLADSIRKKVLKREMPPWPADPAASMKLLNDGRLSQRDIDTLVAWVDAGAPKGNDADLPPVPPFTQGWLHPEGLAPDFVIKLPKFQVPATGEIPYIRFMVKVPFSEDKWITAMQVRPGNRALVHHMAITEVELADGVTPADLDRIAKIGQQLGLGKAPVVTHSAVPDPSNPAVFDMLGVYTPGTTFELCKDGSAKLLKSGKNLYLNFNIHYQTLGKPEEDQSMLALWFRPGPPKHQLFRVPASGQTVIVEGKELLTDAPGEKAEGTVVAIPPIPAYAENYKVIGITAYTKPVTIYQLQPHAHLRGKDFKYEVVYPDGREQTVLSVPKYDFHWQLAYELETPLKLPAGSKLVVTAHYDNSLKNERLSQHGNHDAGSTAPTFGPEKEVFFREQNQSWDEMFSPFVQYSIENEIPGKATNAAQPPETQKNDGDSRQNESAEHTTLDIAQVVGCLEQSSSATWTLTRASVPIVFPTPATSSAELRSAAARSLGSQRYRLLGAAIFNPSDHKGEKVAIKGVLIKGANYSRLNVTSLQKVSPTCSN